MSNYALKLMFKGTAYSGWQVQKNAVGIQSIVQDAIENVFGERLGVSGCSRTDSGVHANEYFCHVKNAPVFDTNKLPLALNTHLPRDISVTAAFEVDDSFHSRYSAKGKEYLYLLWNSKTPNPFHTDTALWYPKYIDCDFADEVARDFVGKHDFSAFMAAHSKIKDTVRDVWYFRVEREGDYVKFVVAADGFLYNMVRIMSGTLLQISNRKIKAPVSSIINSKQRSNAGMTLPAHGLYLNKVFY